MLGRTRPLREAREASCAPTTVSNPNGEQSRHVMRPSCEESLQDTATTKWYLRCHHIGGNEDSTLVVYTAHNLLVGHSEGLCCHANQGEQTKSINYSAFHGYTSRSSEWHRSTSGNSSGVLANSKYGLEPTTAEANAIHEPTANANPRFKVTLPGRALYRPPGIPVLVGSGSYSPTQQGIPTHRYGGPALLRHTTASNVTAIQLVCYPQRHGSQP